MLHVHRWKCRTQKIAIWEPTSLLGYIFATKARIGNLKKLVKQQCLPHMSTQFGELGLLAAVIGLVSLGDSSKFQRVSRLGSFTARHSTSGRQPNCGVEQRAPPIFGRAAITLGIGPHF